MAVRQGYGVERHLFALKVSFPPVFGLCLDQSSLTSCAASVCQQRTRGRATRVVHVRCAEENDRQHLVNVHTCQRRDHKRWLWASGICWVSGGGHAGMLVEA